MNTFKLVIAGTRQWCNYDLLKKTVDDLLVNKKKDHQIEIVSGGAQGPDTLGRAYANEMGYRISVHPADWDAEGRSAGMRRNERMAQYADAAVLFWDGKSPGTRHMVQTMLDLGKPLRIYLVDSLEQTILGPVSVKEAMNAAR